MAAPISLLTPNWTAHHQGFPKTRQVKPNPLPPRPVEEPARWPCSGGFSCGYPQIIHFKIGSSVVNHPCCGVSIYGNLQMLLYFYVYSILVSIELFLWPSTCAHCIPTLNVGVSLDGGSRKNIWRWKPCVHTMWMRKRNTTVDNITIYISYSQMQVLSWVRHELCAQKCTGSKTMLSQNWKGPGMILA